MEGLLRERKGKMIRGMGILLAAAVVFSILLSGGAASAAESASGDFGTNNAFHWLVTEDGVLTVTGTGELMIRNINAAPWQEYKEGIKKL